MSKFFCLNLDEFFNYKLIGDPYIIKDKFPFIINRGIEGRLFKPEQLPESGQEVMIENIPFKFPDKSNDKYDNVQCEEQLITIPKGKYSMIHTLGLCEWEDCKEKVGVMYCDESFAEEKIYFYQWAKDKEQIWEYDEIDKNLVTALTANVHRIKGKRTLMRKIYYYKTIIRDYDKDLLSIRLPYNPNMHIFSITLQSV